MRIGSLHVSLMLSIVILRMLIVQHVDLIFSLFK